MATVTTYSFNGQDQDYTVPAGVTSVSVYMWGAGGGGGGGVPTQYGNITYGAAGAFVSGTLTVVPGATYKVMVGGGGARILSGVGAATYGGGGGVNVYPTWEAAGTGGGRSAIQLPLAISTASGSGTVVTYTVTTNHGLVVNQPVIISSMTTTAYNGNYIVTSVPTLTTFTVASTATGAGSSGTLLAELVDIGGGGGGGGFSATGGSATYSGSANGGTNGANQGERTTGGTQTGGGTGVSGGGNGTVLQGGLGGPNSNGGAGGGGGYYGGGGSKYNAGGGGGSSYTSNPNFSLIAGANSTANGYAAPGTTSPYYVTGVAVSSQNNGGNGLVVIVSPPMCFTAESNLLTPSGYKSAADIHTGDLLMTADGRKVPVKAYKATVVGTKVTAPFLVKKGALGMGCPKADLRLSPWHAIQMNNGLWMKPQSFSELFPGSVQQYDIGKIVTYYHFEAPNFFKDNLICDGTVVESYGGDQLENVKGRVYNYDAKLGGYTRISGKPAAKKLLL